MRNGTVGMIPAGSVNNNKNNSAANKSGVLGGSARGIENANMASQFDGEAYPVEHFAQLADFYYSLMPKKDNNQLRSRSIFQSRDMSAVPH